jgi:hypothetical protein
VARTEVRVLTRRIARRAKYHTLAARICDAVDEPANIDNLEDNSGIFKEAENCQADSET